MKQMLLLALSTLLAAAACGGTSKSAAPANRSSTTQAAAAAPTECPPGRVRVAGFCEKACQTAADCHAETGETCEEASLADERDTNADGTMGAVLEPVRICQGD